jgi:hypothetical protein
VTLYSMHFLELSIRCGLIIASALRASGSCRAQRNAPGGADLRNLVDCTVTVTSPGGRAPDALETAVGDDVVAFGDDQLVLVAQRRRSRADEVEQSPRPGAIWALCWM